MENMLSFPTETLLGLVLTGFLLGWSVAWPPGPVNMEIVRRGSLHGFWSGYSLCLGGVTGDAVWAIAIFAGTAILATTLLQSGILMGVSLTILLLLAMHYFWTAFLDMRHWRAGNEHVRSAAIDSARSGFGLGLVLTLTSPWSIAFWLGVSGLIDTGSVSSPAIALLIASIMVGAAAWGLLLCSAVQPLRPFLRRTLWHAGAKFLTGLFLAWLAVTRLMTI